MDAATNASFSPHDATYGSNNMLRERRSIFLITGMSCTLDASSKVLERAGVNGWLPDLTWPWMLRRTKLSSCYFPVQVPCCAARNDFAGSLDGRSAVTEWVSGFSDSLYRAAGHRLSSHCIATLGIFNLASMVGLNLGLSFLHEKAHQCPALLGLVSARSLPGSPTQLEPPCLLLWCILCLTLS